jgi:hypothetical protein
VDAWQHVERTGTKGPCGLTPFRVFRRDAVQGQTHRRGRSGSLRALSHPWYGIVFLFGGHGEGETPVPIPNTAVKPLSADGTARATGWESRSPPILLTHTLSSLDRPSPSQGRLLSAPEPNPN